MLQDRLLTYEEKAELRGIEKGIEKVARNMFNDGIPLETIVKYTSLPRESVEKLQ
jgi:hypothetical protein